MRLAHVALVAVLLVGVPVADATTCAGEELSGSVETSVVLQASVVTGAQLASDVGDHDSKRPGEAQHCIHGHCHHSTPFKCNDAVAHALAIGAICAFPVGTDMVPTHVSAGLERPPKA